MHLSKLRPEEIRARPIPDDSLTDLNLLNGKPVKIHPLLSHLLLIFFNGLHVIFFWKKQSYLAISDENLTFLNL